MIKRQYFFLAEGYENNQLCGKYGRTMSIKSWTPMPHENLLTQTKAAIERELNDDRIEVMIVALNRI